MHACRTLFYFHACECSGMKLVGKAEWSVMKLTGQRKTTFIDANTNDVFTAKNLKRSFIHPL